MSVLGKGREKRAEPELCLGYLGPRGSYSYAAAKEYGGRLGRSARYIELPDFAAVIRGVETGGIQWGILPVENSTQGVIPAVADMLLELEKSFVCGEIVLDIRLCLLTMGSEDAAVHTIFSHEQALAQCRSFLRSRYPDVRQTSCESTSQACRIAKEKGWGWGAVAGREAAEVYGLRIIDSDIQDNPKNQTRFLVLGREAVLPTGRDKTMVAFSFLEDGPGTLLRALTVFDHYGINLTRIESRPARRSLGQYIFHVDFAGHCRGESVKAALKELSFQTEWVRILGSYPVWREDEERGEICAGSFAQRN